jgi:hypothetical protein
MPTILRADGFRIYFYSHEPGEPPHVHIDRGGSTAKVWLESVGIASNAGFPARELADVLRLVTSRRSWRRGMAFLTQAETADIRVRDVLTTQDELSVALMDGRTIIVPLAWYPRLADATPEQRARWEISGAGYGIHWPDLDEDVSTEGLLRGSPAPRDSAKWRSQYSA